MKTQCKTKGATTYFIISGLKPEYHDAAKDLYYISSEDGFTKNFPADTPNLDRVYHNFERRAEEMILQTARVHPVPWEKALTTFLNIVKNKHLDWWLTGSTALAVRGIDVLPRDIDLTVAEADCMKLGELLADYLVEPVTPCVGWIANWFGRAFLHARLEWVGRSVPK